MYEVSYGSNLSVHKAKNWREACDFMLHCLRNDTRVTGVRKVVK